MAIEIKFIDYAGIAMRYYGCVGLQRLVRTQTSDESWVIKQTPEAAGKSGKLYALAGTSDVNYLLGESSIYANFEVRARCQRAGQDQENDTSLHFDSPA
jgi:hypothetical protein